MYHKPKLYINSSETLFKCFGLISFTCSLYVLRPSCNLFRGIVRQLKTDANSVVRRNRQQICQFKIQKFLFSIVKSSLEHEPLIHVFVDNCHCQNRIIHLFQGLLYIDDVTNKIEGLTVMQLYIQGLLLLHESKLFNFNHLLAINTSNRFIKLRLLKQSSLSIINGSVQS